MCVVCVKLWSCGFGGYYSGVWSDYFNQLLPQLKVSVQAFRAVMLHSTSLSSVLDFLKLMVPLPGFHIGFWAWNKK